MNQNIYYNILKAFLDGETYNKYQSGISRDALKTSSPELFRVFCALEQLHGSTPRLFNISDLELKFYALYPQAQASVFGSIFQSIDKAAAQASSVREYLDSAARMEAANELSLLHLQFAQGQLSFEEFTAKEAPLREVFAVGAKIQYELAPNEFVTDDLEELYNLRRASHGLRWRMESLNRSLGSLREGDFGIIFARPECGKTTFISSEISYMVCQSDRPVIWFNNEEQGTKVKVRTMQAAFNVTLETLYGNRPKYNQQWKDVFKGRFNIKDEAATTRKEVDKLLQIVRPRLIIFDQLDKVSGFTGDRPDLEHKARYQWARECAKTYNASVIGVCQAGATAEYKKYLDMNDIDGSKTAKQGEADWILGIGQSDDEGKERLRFLSLIKNKLEGDVDTKPELRHNKWIVRIAPERARYEDT